MRETLKRGVKMKLYNQIKPKHFNDRTGINPSARKYKENNIHAIRALYELADKHGDVEAKDFNLAVKALLAQEFFGHKIAANSYDLGKALHAFQKAWPKIEDNNPLLAADIQTMLGGFYNGLDDFDRAKEAYCENAEYPVYFDVVEYLNSLVDENGNLKNNADTAQAEYSRLAIAWKAEIKKECENETDGSQQQ